MAGVLLGRPAKPYPTHVVDAVARALVTVEGVAEAHFPQMFALGMMETAEQTLIVVLGRDRDEQAVMNEVVEAVRKELPEGPDFPMFPMVGRDGLLSTVRGTACPIYRSYTERPAPRPWWRFW